MFRYRGNIVKQLHGRVAMEKSGKETLYGKTGVLFVNCEDASPGATVTIGTKTVTILAVHENSAFTDKIPCTTIPVPS
jgi:hypothetical protein